VAIGVLGLTFTLMTRLPRLRTQPVDATR
jgi:hypothetical protein